MHTNVAAAAASDESAGGDCVGLHAKCSYVTRC